MVNHGHILVNGNKIDIPSYKVEPGTEISLTIFFKLKYILPKLYSAVYSKSAFIIIKG